MGIRVKNPVLTANAEEKEINRAARMDTRHEDAGDRL
mgnify:CR=1 FL=1